MAQHLPSDDERAAWFGSLTWPERCVYDRAYSAAWAKNGQNDNAADMDARATVEHKRSKRAADAARKDSHEH